jgi:Ca-activated chloride channel family protein
MHLLSPAWLLLLLGVAALAGVYVWFQLRRPGQAIRFTNLDLLDSVAPDRPGWRKHVVAGVFGVALVLLVVALAQPARTVRIPKEEATVMLAIDASFSMEADDVEPTRLEAAQVAAADFAASAPDELNLGLVTFSGTTTVEVPPTIDHDAVVDAIGEMELGPGTAIGDGIAASVDAIGDVAAEAGGEVPPGTVVLLSDGSNQGIRNPKVVLVAALVWEFFLV